MTQRLIGLLACRSALALSLGLGLLLAACGGGETSKPAPAAHSTFIYHLGPGDSLNISVYEQPDLTGKYVVDGNGGLAFPLIGRVAAGGKTADEVRAIITTELNNGFLVNPKVTVQVGSYRPYYILGEVTKPGSYSYVEGLTIREAVAVAGGFTKIAHESNIKVTHPGVAVGNTVEEGPDDFVEPGDTITVERRLF
jgi:protein involved in polysaccharide export with SLBB domain